MITKIDEYEYGISITIIPETPKEMALLLRMTVNTKRIVPDIRTYFDDMDNNCQIWLKKRTGKRTSISNENSVLP